MSDTFDPYGAYELLLSQIAGPYAKGEKNPYGPAKDQIAMTKAYWQMLGIDPVDFVGYGTNLDPMTQWDQQNPKPTPESVAAVNARPAAGGYLRYQYRGDDTMSQAAQRTMDLIDSGETALSVISKIRENASAYEEGVDPVELEKIARSYEQEVFKNDSGSAQGGADPYQVALQKWQQRRLQAQQDIQKGGLFNGGGPGQSGLPEGDPFTPDGPSLGQQGLTLEDLLGGGGAQQRSLAGWGKDQGEVMAGPKLLEGRRGGGGGWQSTRPEDRKAVQAVNSSRWAATPQPRVHAPIYDRPRTNEQDMIWNGRGATVDLLKRALKVPGRNPAYDARVQREALLARLLGTG